jgi:hypothetical protein
MGLIIDYLTKSSRKLTDEEINDAKRVFEDKIPYGRIIVSDDLGLGDREWTEPVGPLYNLHLGPKGYKSTNDHFELRWTLIHELTHAWQGANHVFDISYVLSSGWSQLLYGSGAYAYSPGQDWGDYNAEQQAHIVEDWYKRGLQVSDSNFRYIRDHIRSPVKSWFKELGSQAASIANDV